MENWYRERVDRDHLQYDEAQMAVLRHLEYLLVQVEKNAGYATGPKWNLKKWTTSSHPVRGVYLFGGVGCGKSMLMDLFFQACTLKQKRRVHFHVFMREVHEFVHRWRQERKSSPIPPLAKKIRETAVLFCFDEFHVTDIADAMILGRLFGELFDLGVILVTTSNRHPDDLYHGGLQRERFLPFIDLLKDNTEVLELKAKEDYRLIHINGMESTYYYPLNNDADLFLLHCWNELTNTAPMRSESIRVMGREIRISNVHGDIAMASFEELCMQPLGASDYLEIARRFSTLIVARIPVFFHESRDEAKRFVTLIDILYERRVKLICTAEAPPQGLYLEGDGAFEFERTVSRLMEMQTDNYLHGEHFSG
ncbi:MAG: cell division protein ZapE [Gammaproteobacteria bacterium]